MAKASFHPSPMEKSNQKNVWKAVPQFGAWNHKTADATNYSMVFSQARANRKQYKSDLSRASLGDEHELIARARVETPTKRKKLMRYFSCCARL